MSSIYGNDAKLLSQGISIIVQSVRRVTYEKLVFACRCQLASRNGVLRHGGGAWDAKRLREIFQRSGGRVIAALWLQMGEDSWTDKSDAIQRCWILLHQCDLEIRRGNSEQPRAFDEGSPNLNLYK